MDSRRASCLLAALAALAPLARADVLTVDDDGPADFADLPQAVAAAAPGDLLLVAPGTYAGFTLDALALTVMSSVPPDDEFPVQITTPVLVRNLAAGQTVLLSGLRVDEPGFRQGFTGEAVSVEQCAGSVRLADCVLVGFQEPPPLAVPTSWAGLRAVGSHDVVLTGCKLTGSHGALSSPVNGAGGAGLRVEQSSVTGWDCRVNGGHGGGLEFSSDVPADGGPGALVVGGSLVLEGCEVFGGDGPFSDIQTTAGGDGLVADAASVVRLRDTAVHGGAGGYQWIGSSILQGPDGEDFVVAGALQTLPGVPTLLATTEAATMPGAMFRIQSNGSGLLLAGLQGANTWLPAWSAPLHVSEALLIPVASFPLTVLTPPLPASFTGALLHLQLARSTHELSEPACLRLELTLP